MSNSSRARARTWLYPRHRDFERGLREAASAWFEAKGFAVSARYSYILADREKWTQNIILPEVAEYIRKEHARWEVQRRGFPLHKYAHHGRNLRVVVEEVRGS